MKSTLGLVDCKVQPKNLLTTCKKFEIQKAMSSTELNEVSVLLQHEL
jgi:hypothetical protein